MAMSWSEFVSKGSEVMRRVEPVAERPGLLGRILGALAKVDWEKVFRLAMRLLSIYLAANGSPVSFDVVRLDDRSERAIEDVFGGSASTLPLEDSRGTRS